MMLVMHIVPGPALSSATRGMSDASRRMDAAAESVAGDSPDLVSDLVEATIVAPGAYMANATVVRTAAEMQRHLLDIRA
jgi:hypothetical protein